MKKIITIFIATVIVGFLGYIIDVTLDGKGALGIIFAIAIAGGFIVHAIDDTVTK